MNRRKAFFVSFTVSMAAVLAVYLLMWTGLQNRSRETDTPQTNIPKPVPGVQDSKSILLCLGDEDNPYFFIVKMSAITKRIGIGCISPSYRCSQGESLAQSFRKAGVKQCLLDIENEFGIDIDYYLHCSWKQAAQLTENMDDIGLEKLGEDMPPVIKNYLLESAEKTDGRTLINCAEKAAGFLDNEIGLAFLTESMAQLIINNPSCLPQIADNVKNIYSSLITNLNTESLVGMKRIAEFISDSYVEYPRDVILKNDSKAKEKINFVLE